MLFIYLFVATPLRAKDYFGGGTNVHFMCIQAKHTGCVEAEV